jgi:hypothetical protein
MTGPSPRFSCPWSKRHPRSASHLMEVMRARNYGDFPLNALGGLAPCGTVTCREHSVADTLNRSPRSLVQLRRPGMIRWIAVCATAVSLAIAADVTVSSSAYALFGRSSKQAISKECSKQADAKGLHGKARKTFRAKCKRHGGKPT